MLCGFELTKCRLDVINQLKSFGFICCRDKINWASYNSSCSLKNVELLLSFHDYLIVDQHWRVHASCAMYFVWRWLQYFILSFSIFQSEFDWFRWGSLVSRLHSESHVCCVHHRCVLLNMLYITFDILLFSRLNHLSASVHCLFTRVVVYTLSSSCCFNISAHLQSSELKT